MSDKYMNNKELGLILSRTYLAFKRAATRQMSSFGLTPEQFSVLSELSKTNGVSQKRLAELTERDQTTVGKILDKLIKKELVSRSVDPSDRRAVQLNITSKGLDLHTQIWPELEMLENRVYEGLEDTEIESFISTLNKMYDNLS
ncbi:MarR family transcriptional regulator [Niallia taxi]|uniref:MarR family winged helix-turn-helix transcriptional regulator n=1 Tax=Niallia taxi TaxID=2499688 RepID=UPI002E1CE1AE|nr:MarR family transcriptional regulator [Niallia taxi]MED4054946.1 MarR family transcriptional regulator [Niallia taxi]MED4121042.1 MarR family transcriptional regulator [Niallia taxi]